MPIARVVNFVVPYYQKSIALLPPFEDSNFLSKNQEGYL
jgi:hypothetical protein